VFGAFPSKATVVEVGPRDGLQSEKDVVSTATKVALIDHLSEAGYAHIEATSFVNPRWVPQLADAKEVARRIRRHKGVSYSALVPNMQGLMAALEANMDEIVLFAAASETFSRKNLNRGIGESLSAYEEVAKEALRAGKTVRAYISTVWGCPYEGRVDAKQVLEVTRRLLAMGARQVSLGDTIGIATPKAVQEVLQLLLRPIAEPQLALHFHDTRGMGMVNVLAGLDMGVTTYDSSLGGLGGCPYAPGATGNIASEDLLYLLKETGIETGIELDAVVEASKYLAHALGRELPSRYLRAKLSERRP
jgi:hydroxymethylglutaryl-CoA lyase